MARGHKRAIMCVETGEKFISISEAAKKHELQYGGISQALRIGCKCGGLHWSYLEEGDIAPPAPDTTFRRFVIKGTLTECSYPPELSFSTSSSSLAFQDCSVVLPRQSTTVSSPQNSDCGFDHGPSLVHLLTQWLIGSAEHNLPACTDPWMVNADCHDHSGMRKHYM
eukprot:g9390.t1